MILTRSKLLGWPFLSERKENLHEGILRTLLLLFFLLVLDSSSEDDDDDANMSSSRSGGPSWVQAEPRRGSLPDRTASGRVFWVKKTLSPESLSRHTWTQVRLR